MTDVAYYETDPAVLAWFDRALTHGSSYVRMAALVLLGDVDSAHRGSWLRRAQSDPVAEVVATAVLTEAFVTVADSVSADLFESDFAESLERGDLIWEWEYDIVVAHDVVVQLGRRKAWVAVEDDALARRLALQKAYCRQGVRDPLGDGDHRGQTLREPVHALAAFDGGSIVVDAKGETALPRMSAGHHSAATAGTARRSRSEMAPSAHADRHTPQPQQR